MTLYEFEKDRTALVRNVVGAPAMTAIKLATAALEAGGRITSACLRGDGQWNINIRARSPCGKFHTSRLHGLSPAEAAGFIGVLGKPQNMQSPKG